MSVAPDGRYSRQEWVPTLGVAGQRAISKASVAVVGAGGVKSPLLLYLAAAGVGRLRVIDADRVELSNLNRQILYGTPDIGRPKAEVAAEALRRLNPEIEVEGIVAHVGTDSFDQLLGGHDLVFEGGESATERLDFNRWALARRVRYLHASAQYNYAHVLTVVPGVSACFECCFDDLPATHGGPVPIMGPAAGVAGSIGASEALGLLAGRPPTLCDKVFFFDGLSNWATHLPVRRNPACPACSSLGAATSRAASAENLSRP